VAGEKKASGGGLSVQTLLISSLSAVVATLVVSQFWAKGTLLFTALVPVVVALTTEALRRPAERITQVSPLRVPARRAPGPTGTAVHEPEIPEEARRKDPFGLHEPEPARPLERRWVQVGLITGLVAFLIGAAVVTASELALFERSVGGGDRRTTLLGGEAPARETPTPAPVPGTATPAPVPPGATPAPAPTEPDATPTPTPTQTPTATATPVPDTTPPPAATPAPPDPDPTPAPTP